MKQLCVTSVLSLSVHCRYRCTVVIVHCRYRCTVVIGALSLSVHCRYRCTVFIGALSLSVHCRYRCTVVIGALSLSVHCRYRCTVVISVLSLSVTACWLCISTGSCTVVISHCMLAVYFYRIVSTTTCLRSPCQLSRSVNKPVLLRSSVFANHSLSLLALCCHLSRLLLVLWKYACLNNIR